MTVDELKALFKEVQKDSDFWINLYYKGNEVATIYGDSDFDSISIEERSDCLLVYDDSFGILCDNAIIDSY